MRAYIGTLSRDSMPSKGVFVFGSNPLGINGNPEKGTGGAALVAHLEFGVKKGERMINCMSQSDQAYGIVTVKAPKQFIPDAQVQENVAKFYEYALSRPDRDFYVVYDGKNPTATSLNGKSRRTLAKIFYRAGKIPGNVIFEERFAQLIIDQQKLEIFQHNNLF